MQKPTCTIEGCERPQKARGWCSVHYVRWWKHGDPTINLRAMLKVGDRFHRLTVISTELPRYQCRCDCGREVVVWQYLLTNGKQKSCGCLAIKHGHTSGGRPSPTYNSWRSAVKRTTDPTHHGWRYYGGRGIRLCDEWLDFAGFLRDMGERPPNTTLDRVDPDGNYEPGNCRWASALVQARNQRSDPMDFVFWSE